MKIVNVKGMVTKLMLAGLAAGAFIIASPTKAQAQQLAVGVQFGHPAYAVDGVDYRYGNDFRRHEEFREREQREQFARRQAFLRHEEWERAHRFERPYGYR